MIDTGKNFALTGVAGYVAPRHLDAIKRTGSELLAAIDPHDSVGILDSFFPKAAFFSEYERFDRFLEKRRRLGPDGQVHWVSICSPNYLHDAHIRTALRIGANAICEKPLVLDPRNLDVLEELEEETGQRVWTILQLRVHPKLLALKEKIQRSDRSARHRVVLTYVAPRGNWYRYSWKGNPERSGGICANIGIHFFDLLSWFFGRSEKITVHVADDRTSAGVIDTPTAEIKWLLSIDEAWMPRSADTSSVSSFRSISIDEEEVEFSGGFTDLHYEVYKATLAGNGFSIADTRESIATVYKIRFLSTTSIGQNAHPFLKRR